ncbi:MAG TPA: TfoX/Sxy family protein [Methanocorpusculum sp.]|nr:TfoX/Sxy family protein [Methanocorpusculum sp.]
MEQLSNLDDVSYRPMMGEYLLYYRGKLFGGIYDNRFLVKPVSSAEKMMPDAVFELPYEGASKMILVDNPDDSEFLCQLVQAMYNELPSRKKK